MNIVNKEIFLIGEHASDARDASQHSNTYYGCYDQCQHKFGSCGIRFPMLVLLASMFMISLCILSLFNPDAHGEEIHHHSKMSNKEDTARRWVIVSVAFKAGTRMKKDKYLPCLPFIVAGWKRLGWTVVVVGVGEENLFLTSEKNMKARLLTIDSKVRFLYVLSSEAQAISVAQISRLFVATQPWIKQNDTLMTSDIDILPIKRYFDGWNFNQSVAILFANCCGTFQWGTQKENVSKVTMYPMTNIVASKYTWMKFMDLDSTFNLTVSDLQTWLDKNYGTLIPDTKVGRGSFHWYMDQRVVSIQLHKHEAHTSIIKINRRPRKDRIDRIYAMTWPSKFSEEQLLGKRDMHMFHDIWQGEKGKHWNETRNIVIRLFDSHTQDLILSPVTTSLHNNQSL